jgi:CheY-like chemotaxis protein
MDAIERLAGGVAHEFNNLLTTVIGFSDLIEATLAEADPRRDDLGEIRGAAERGAALTQQLLALGRGHTLRPSIVDLNDVVADAMPRLHRLLGPTVQVQTELGSRGALVRVDRAHLEQALTSLAVNARDAMPHGGTFTIRTADDETSVVLVVSDTGVGMEPNVVAHLFEPFFTTKGQGAGSGLGLASVHGVVRQSGGRIDVDSAPGAGARFTIFLPKASPIPPAHNGHRGGGGGAGTRSVLVVEDEPSVRRLAEQVLAGHGYRVASAPSGEDALALVTGDGADVDVLVTDIVMPGISGLELAEQLVQLRPGLRVIYVSGYVDESALRLTAVEPSGFLAKPFTPGALLARVERALSAAQVR